MRDDFESPFVIRCRSRRTYLARLRHVSDFAWKCIPLLFLTALVPSCGPGPFVRTAASYATANNDSVRALATAPRTADRICKKKAKFNYLQVRLGIMEAPQPIPWTKWYATAKATDKQTWQQYCADLEATGTVFSVALNVLHEYGSALNQLSNQGYYSGSDIQNIAAGASQVATTLGNTTAGEAIKPVGAVLGGFASFLIQDITEDKMEDYVRRADPLVQTIAQRLQDYVDAVDAELRLTENTQNQTLLALESRSELIGQNVDPAKLTVFYNFAVETETDMQDTRKILTGYKSVLEKLRAAHAALVKAGGQDDDTEIKKALGSIFELVGQLQTLNLALSKE